MSVRELIRMGREYFMSALIICIIMVAVFLTGYFLLYRKLLKGERRIRAGRMIWCAVMLIYLFVVAGATLFSRGTYFGKGEVSALFSSYREAYIQQKPVLWRNLILNYLMFVPLGILLPAGWRWFRTSWKTYIGGFAVSLLIELTQVFLRRGIFEPDDLLANTVGCMIGYGFYRIGVQILGAHILSKDETKKSGQVFAAQLPLIIVIVVFSVMFLSYAGQELGNNPNQAYECFNPAFLELDGQKNFDTEPQELMVYKVSKLSENEAVTKGRDFLASLGLQPDEKRLDIYDDEIVLFDFAGTHSIWVSYTGGTMRYTDYEALSPTRGEETIATGAAEGEVRSALAKLKIELPAEAAFSETEMGRYRFELNMYDDAGSVYDGALECQYSDKGKIVQFNDRILSLTVYRSYPAISMQEAYEKLEQGEFLAYLPGNFHRITVNGGRIGYSIDTKGYYQPDYCFDCTVEGANVVLRVPALR